jgi:hypothetical protein
MLTDTGLVIGGRKVRTKAYVCLPENSQHEAHLEVPLEVPPDQ